MVYLGSHNIDPLPIISYAQKLLDMIIFPHIIRIFFKSRIKLQSITEI